MKTKLLTLLLILGIGLLTSCGNDDNDLPQEKTIHGTWFLKNVQGGMTYSDIDYPRGIVRWNFNPNNGTLTVENKIENVNALGVSTGIYDYDIALCSETQVIFLDNGTRLEIVLLNSNLLLSDGFADGYSAEFTR